MKRILFSILMLSGLVSGVVSFASVARADDPSDPQTLKMKLGIGLGWQLCPEDSGSDEPPLGGAFFCSGLVATIMPVDLVLVKKPAAKPEWKYFEATYTDTVQFKDVTSKIELLVMYAKYDGHVSGFVDGRISSVRANGKKTQTVYFRSSAEGGLSALTYSSSYGLPVKIDMTGGTQSDYSPYVAIKGLP